eukprot:4750781-Alexandrium_andersonii.AAC.1
MLAAFSHWSKAARTAPKRLGLPETAAHCPKLCVGLRPETPGPGSLGAWGEGHVVRSRPRDP